MDAQASLGRTASPTSYDVLAGDAQSWGGPGGLGLVVLPERTRWLLPGAPDPDAALSGPTRHTPWIPLALAAAEAWQQTEAAREAEAAEAFALVSGSGPQRPRSPMSRSWATRSTGSPMW